MKKIIFISAILISMFFLTACENVDLSKVSDEDLGRIAEKAIVCDKPYIRFGTSCCLDTNEDNICDKDEGIKEEKTSEEGIEKFLPAKCTLSTEFSCIDFKVTSNQIQLILRNDMGVDVANIKVELENCGSVSTPSTFLKGESQEYIIKCYPQLSGTKYKGELSVTYAATAGFTHKAIGTLESDIEEEPPQEKTIETKYTLVDYPSFFIKGNSFDGVMAVGDKAPSEDVIGISDIAMSIQQANIPKNGINIEIGATYLVSEVPNLYGTNAILVGTPCVNKLVAELMNSDLTKCSGNDYLGFEKGQGIIKLYEVSGKAYVLVTGYSPADVRMATKALANYGDYSFSGTEWFTP